MSKRAKLHKEYFKQHGTRKGSSKVFEHYIKWLKDKVLGLTTESNYSLCGTSHHAWLRVDQYWDKCAMCGEIRATRISS